MADLGSYHRVERQEDVAARGSRPAAPAQITLAPIVLIKGPEGLLVDRALDRLRALAYQADPNLERTDINAATYQAGRVEATGYDVADAAVAGNSAKALTLARHAFATGIAPQVLVAALAMKFRAMAKVSIGGAASALKMAPWQVDRARRELRGWSDASLAGAFGAIATADAETKGASRDPERAIEKAIITICRLHGR